MIINSHDLLAGLGSPQAADENLGETHGAQTFAQFLDQDAEAPEALAALLASLSQVPTRPLPGLLRLSGLSLDPSAGADAPEAGLTEEESRALDDILAALQTLFPGLMLGLSFAPPATTAAEGGAIVVPEDGQGNPGGLAALGDLPLLVAPVQSVGEVESTADTEGAGDVDVSPPQRASTIESESVLAPAAAGVALPGGSQPIAVNDGHQEAPEFGTSSPAPRVAEPTVPELHASRTADHATDAILQEPQSGVSATLSPLAQSLQEDEMTLRPSVQETRSDDSAATMVAAPWQQARQRGLADTRVLTRDETSSSRQDQASVPTRVPNETFSVSSAPFTDASKAALDEAESPHSAPPPAAASLRYVPGSRGTVLLQLEPPELGTLLVQVRQSHEHLTASFWAESSEVRSLLQAHFPALNQALSQQGVSTQQISLQLGDGDGFAEQFGQSSQQHGAPHTFSHGDRDEGSAGRRRGLGSSTTPHRLGDGRVDIRI